MNFTDVEKKLLEYTAQGMDMSQILEKMCYSTATLYVYFCNIYAKTKDICPYRSLKNKFIDLQEFLQTDKGKEFLIKNGVKIEESTNETSSVPAEDLTEKEKLVYEKLVNGKSYENVAREECLSLATIKTHVAAIFQKLNVNSLPELIVDYYQNKTKAAQQPDIKTAPTNVAKVENLQKKYDSEIGACNEKIQNLKSEIKTIQLKRDVLQELISELQKSDTEDIASEKQELLHKRVR